MNRKRSFISKRIDELDISNLLTIPKGNYRYINIPISKNVNMNNRTIINCNECMNDVMNDVYTITMYE